MCIAFLGLNSNQFQWMAFFCFILPVLHAEIITDGTAGPAQTLTGPNFTISEDLGTRAGDNLFHSFEHFNIATGEQATFTGPPTISNVISRVTGGDVSTINGLLRSEVGQADFYFINPAGVVFGAGTQIDVPASFYVSTADELRFADDTVYSASNLPTSTWSVGQPQSFGFLGDQTATISLTETELMLTPGNTLSLSAGELQINTAQLLAEQGEIQLTATGNNATTVTIGGDLSEPAQGDLNITHSAIDVSGDGAGRISIRSGASQINGSTVFADNRGATDPGIEQGIDIQVKSLRIANSQVSTDTLGQGHHSADLSVQVAGELSIVSGGIVNSITSTAGDAGNISVHAGTLLIDNNEGETTGILNGVIKGSGSAGIVRIIVDGSLSILNGGKILSNSIDSVNTGRIIIRANNVELDSNAFISAGTAGISNAGTIEITADESLTVVDGSGIASNAASNSQGTAGNIIVQAQNFTLDGQGFISSASAGGGDAGKIQIIVEESVNVNNSATISSDTASNGQGGEIIIRAETLTLDGQGSTTGISSSTAGTKDAGNVDITVTNLNILDGAGIASGAVDISDNPDAPLVTGTATGNAGQITIHADNVTINDGVISIESNLNADLVVPPSFNSANIQITAQTIELSGSLVISDSSRNIPAGSIELNNVNRLSLNSSGISTIANNANGGPITVDANILDLQNSQISTSVLGQGNGGNISLNSDVLVLDSAFILADTDGTDASGGNIQINTDALIASQNNLQIGGNNSPIIEPNSGTNVIRAAAQAGISGTIDITSLQLNISGDLASLKSNLLDIDQITQNPCIAPGTKQSTLVSLGHGGLPESLEQAGSITLNAERLQQLLPLSKPIPNSSSSASDSKLAQQPAWQTTTECQP